MFTYDIENGEIMKVFENILEKNPRFRKYLVHLIECTKQVCVDQGIKETYLMASEGTIESGIFDRYFSEAGVKCLAPTVNEYAELRCFIEAVKQNNITEDIKSRFVNYIENAETEVVILGCTELPIIYKECKGMFSDKKVIIDPIECAIKKIKAE